MSKVFIIDDDLIHQRIAQIMITRHNLFDEYISYTEAELALNFLESNAENQEALPDVILLDLNMPGMDGWEFLEQFEKVQIKLAKQTKIFIVSSSVDEKDKTRSQTYSFVCGFISKPLSPEILKNTAC